MQTEARDIDDRNRVRPALGQLGEKGRRECLESLAIDIATAGHVEAGLLQLIGDQPRIIHSGRLGRLWRIGIGALPDHKRQPWPARWRRLCLRRAREQRRASRDRGLQNRSHHVAPLRIIESP